MAGSQAICPETVGDGPTSNADLVLSYVVGGAQGGFFDPGVNSSADLAADTDDRR